MPAIVDDALRYRNHDPDEIQRHVLTKENAAWIREELASRGLVAFVADGARLPRQSGASDEPMADGVVPFESPDEHRVTFEPPTMESIAGMGIPEGVTLIVGGGYHGKSTLLSSLVHGVYDHIPGDGREFVITRSDAVSIRAEDGRPVTETDISPFIGDVPTDLDTERFSTPDASGSTSQAANIVEAVEAGARLLLIDEDTSATNLMIRDDRMRELVTEDEEPITPLVDRVSGLHEIHDVSTVLIMGGSSAYFDVADTVIKMHEFRPTDVTEHAHAIGTETGSGYDVREPSDSSDQAPSSLIEHERCPRPDSIDPRRNGKVRIRSRDDTIEFGETDIELGRVAGITESSQVRSIGDALFYLATEYFDGTTTIGEALDQFDALVESGDLLSIAPYDSGEYGVPRRFEVAMALNRLRSLECTRTV
ncbi:P-loop domain-containing protein [Halopiger thermotolerans]